MIDMRTPIAVEPSLMASREYSTWKSLPSGEKVLRSSVSRRYLQLKNNSMAGLK